jgi:hypothetical protein
MRPGPHHIGTTGASDGDALLYDAEVDEYAPGDVVLEVVEGDGVSVDTTDPKRPVVSAVIPAQLVPLTTVVDGVPDLVWDADNQLVFTEAP